MLICSIERGEGSLKKYNCGDCKNNYEIKGKKMIYCDIFGEFFDINVLRECKYYQKKTIVKSPSSK